MPIDWAQARKPVYETAGQARLDTVTVPLAEADGLVLSDSLVPLYGPARLPHLQR